MIKKTIHYCWFGGEKNSLVKKCIKTWYIHLKGYEIIEWNEKNFDLKMNEYTRNMYKEKKWAFLSDYVRVWAIYNYGGIYLDTDMYLFKNLDSFLEDSFFVGLGPEKKIYGGVFGAVKGFEYLKDLLIFYETNKDKNYVNSLIMQDIYEKNKHKESYELIKTYNHVYFYPLSMSEISKFNKYNFDQRTVAVHMWNYSFGDPISRFLIRSGWHKYFKILLNFIKLDKFARFVKSKIAGL